MSGSEQSMVGWTDETYAALSRRVQQLASREMIGHSPDGRVAVRVTAGGSVTEIRLLDNVLRRYDNAALAELVTRTVRGTQRRARAALQQEVDALYAGAAAEAPPPT